MSDTSQGDGWWLASDGKWYPPPRPDLPARAPITPDVAWNPPSQSQGPPGFAQQTAWRPPNQPVQVVVQHRKSGFGTGCLIGLVLAVVVGLGGCVGLVAIAANSDTGSDSASGSTPPNAIDQGIGSKDATADLVGVEWVPPDMIGAVYVNTTVKNNSEKRSDYLIEVVLESPDGAVKYGDATALIQNVEPGQTTTDKSLFLNVTDPPTDARARVTKLQRTASV